MSNLSFVTQSGLEVHFERFEVCATALGALAGNPPALRRAILQMLPERVARTFGHTGLCVREPVAGPLPYYTFLLQVGGNRGISPAADCSSLVVVWFADKLPGNLPEEMAKQLGDVDWESHAIDGYY